MVTIIELGFKKKMEISMKKILLSLICVFTLVGFASADQMVEITSDDIILLEPGFSTFVKQKLPFYKEKLINLEKPLKTRHLVVEFTDFNGFYKAIRTYFRRTETLNTNIDDFNKEVLEKREKIFEEPGLSSSRAIELILSYKFLKKNIIHSENTIQALNDDMDTLFFVLKRKKITATKTDVATQKNLRSYLGFMVNSFQDLKEEKIDFVKFEDNLKSNLELLKEKDLVKAKLMSNYFFNTGLEVSGTFHLMTEIKSKVNYVFGVIKNIYNFELYVMENKQRTIATWLGTLISIAILVVVFFVIKSTAKKLISDEGIFFMVTTLTNYIIAITIFIILLNGVGMDPTKITYVISALSVGVGFGLSTIISNFIAGIIILVERTILVGDKIKLSDGTVATVERIGIRSSIIRTTLDNDVIVPNTDLINKEVTNLTYKKFAITRNPIPFTVNPDVDFEKLKKVAIESAIKTLGGRDKIVTGEPDVKVTELVAGQLGCVLLVFIDNRDNYIPNRAFKTDLLKAFTDAEIEIFMAPVTAIEIVNDKLDLVTEIKNTAVGSA